MMHRDDQYDIVKGFAIMLMVTAHAAVAFPHVINFIHLFHMPVFFILAGCFVHSPVGLAEWRAEVRKKIRRLWVPYVLWTSLFILLHNLLIRLSIYPDVRGQVVSASLGYAFVPWTWEYVWHSAVRVWSMLDGNYIVLAPLWFLQALTYSLFLYMGVAWAVRRTVRDDRNQVIVLSVLVLALVLFGRYKRSATWTEIFAYVGGARTLTAFALIHVGFVLRRFDGKVRNASGRIRNPVGLGALAALLVFSVFGHGHGFCINEFSSVSFLLLSSVCGWYMLLWVAGLPFVGRRCVAYVGRHTMPILIFHLLVFRVVCNCIMRWTGITEQPSCADIALLPDARWVPVYVLAGILVPLLFNGLFWKAEGLVSARLHVGTRILSLGGRF